MLPGTTVCIVLFRLIFIHIELLISLYINFFIKFEYLLGNDYEYNHKNYGKIKLRGFIDCMNIDSVYEFKCTSELNEEHKCQLIVYYWLWNKSNMNDYYDKKQFKLMNILTEEILELNTNSPYINDIIELLFNNKYNEDIELTDDTFIQLSL